MSAEQPADHAAEARAVLAEALREPIPHDHLERPDLLAEALVHATLALAAEQRTANLIAFYGIAERRGAIAGRDDRRFEALEQQVLERLGLDA